VSRFWSRFSLNSSVRTEFSERVSLPLDEIVGDRAAAFSHGDAPVAEHGLKRGERTTRFAPPRREGVPAEVRVESVDT
jgi:hypothetical protein